MPGLNWFPVWEHLESSCVSSHRGQSWPPNQNFRLLIFLPVSHRELWLLTKCDFWLFNRITVHWGNWGNKALCGLLMLTTFFLIPGDPKDCCDLALREWTWPDQAVSVGLVLGHWTCFLTVSSIPECITGMTVPSKQRGPTLFFLCELWKSRGKQ